MKIDWEQETCGLTLLQIRDLLRFVARPGMTLSAENVARRLLPKDDYEFSQDGIDKAHCRAVQLLSVLAASGVIGMPHDEDLLLADGGRRHVGYGLTPAGYGLLRVTKTRRITRAAADAAVRDLRAAITRINDDPVLMYRVERVALYGSYLTDAPDLGDVDVGYDLKRRWSDKDEYRRMRTRFEEVHAPPAGQIGCYDYEYRWHEKVVTRMLRARACIQLTDLEHVEDLGCPMLLIHPDDREVAASPDYRFERADIRLADDGGKAIAMLDREIDRLIADRRRRDGENRKAIVADPNHPHHDFVKWQVETMAEEQSAQ